MWRAYAAFSAAKAQPKGPAHAGWTALRQRAEDAGPAPLEPPMTSLSRLAALSLLAGAAGAAQAAGTIVLTPAASWGATDAAMGLNPGSVIENFEDITLAAGLSVTVSNGAGGYGPTTTLPRAFDPRPTSLGGDDAFGGAFYNFCGSTACSSIWDGSHVLLNTNNNNSMNYGTGVAWSDVAFNFAGGAMQVGFSLQQNENPINVYVNGAFFGTLPGASGGGRNGYYRFDITPSTGPSDAWTAPITSLVLDGTSGDAWTIDHLAFTTAVPEPGSWALWAAGLLGLSVRRLSRR
jgi:hypothetical protein